MKRENLILTFLLVSFGCSVNQSTDCSIPVISGNYVHVYQPAGDIFPGPDSRHLRAGRFYADWVPNDHCILKGNDGRWHVLGITHPATPIQRGTVHEGEWMSFHAVSDSGALKDVLQTHSWQDRPKVLPPADRPGEKRENHAPTVIWKDTAYVMIYGPTPFRYATSKDMKQWTPKGELQFKGNQEHGRDPSVWYRKGQYYMVYCGHDYTVRATMSKDLIHWADSRVIFQAKEKHHPESPSVIIREGKFYLFWCLWHQMTFDPDKVYNDETFVFCSDDPMQFSYENQVAELRAHAPEVFQDEQGDWYISSAEQPHRGVSIARLIWE
jgi:beta-fructofuranosidase